MITKTWYDPCPRCGGEVKGVDAEPQYVLSNPDSVLSVPDPACPYDPDDPDSPDCTCVAIINPHPDPVYDQRIPVGVTFTMHPCGDVIRSASGRDGKMTGEMAGWKAYQQEVPEPGSLGELMRDWAAEEET